MDDDAPLGEDEKEALRQDLVDVEVLKEVLGSQGIKGTVFFCPDCDEDHYLTWDLLAGNLQELLDAGESPVHEPAFDPDPDDYVSWDYARGFLDGYESFEKEDLDEVALRVMRELQTKGLHPQEVKAFMARVGLEPPSSS
jgi:hypothetical protein